MPNENMVLEHVYFCGREFIGNSLGYNPDAGLVYPVVARKMARRKTSNAPTNRSPANSEVLIKRVNLLLNKPHDFIPLILHTFGRMEIHSCRQLYQAMRCTRDNRELALAFKTEFEETSGGLVLCHKQASYFRFTPMYMNDRWEYDHKYFWRMIEHDEKMKSEAIGGIITNLWEAIESDS